MGRKKIENNLTLLEYLNNTGETQMAFAHRANISQSTVSRAITGVPISPSCARKIEYASNGYVHKERLAFPEV